MFDAWRQRVGRGDAGGLDATSFWWLLSALRPDDYVQAAREAQAVGWAKPRQTFPAQGDVLRPKPGFAVEALPTLLDHPAEEVRYETLERIARLRVASALPAIRQRLTIEPSLEVR